MIILTSELWFKMLVDKLVFDPAADLCGINCDFYCFVFDVWLRILARFGWLYSGFQFWVSRLMKDCFLRWSSSELESDELSWTNTLFFRKKNCSSGDSYILSNYSIINYLRINLTISIFLPILSLARFYFFLSFLSLLDRHKRPYQKFYEVVENFFLS